MFDGSTLRVVKVNLDRSAGHSIAS